MFSGLQCWDNNKGQNDVSELKECSASKSTSCFIVESIAHNEWFPRKCSYNLYFILYLIHFPEKPSKSISQTCSEKSGGWTDNRHQISCYCTTDGSVGKKCCFESIWISFQVQWNLGKVQRDENHCEFLSYNRYCFSLHFPVNCCKWSNKVSSYSPIL